MENKYNILGILGLLFISVFMFNLISVTDIISQSPETLTGDNIEYHSSVCTSVLRVDGTHEDNGCSKNLLTDAGKNLIKDMLSSGSGAGVDYIGLCNSTAGCTSPEAGDTALDNEYTSSGLTRVQATYGSLGTGNWSEVTTFTATVDDLSTNMTGLFNASSGGTLFAENAFTLVTLQTNDQLTINWTIWVE